MFGVMDRKFRRRQLAEQMRVQGMAQAARGEAADLTDIYHEFPELQDRAGS